MAVLRIFLLVAVMALAPAIAADSSVGSSLPVGSSQPAGPSLTVSVGTGGFVSSDRPADVTVTISSPVLVAGRIRVSGGEMAVSRPVEVPAEGQQTYRLTIPPLGDGVRLRVELLDRGGDVITAETATTRARGTDEMVVGVVGSEELVRLLGRVRGVVTDRPVAAFSVPTDLAGRSLDVLDYLVLARGTEQAVPAALRWAETGGSVVVDSSLTVALDAATPAGPDGVARSDVGSGAIVRVDEVDARSTDEWTQILRPTRLDLGSASQRIMGDRSPLLQAASEAGSRQVPSIPWLLFALVGFALVVGPVNFVVLSRLGKRDWAWLTIPALSLIAVFGFWVAGRQRIAGTTLTHASILVDDGGVRARSAVLVAAGVAGERRLAFDGGEVYPERSLFGSGAAELVLDGQSGATVRLDQLGFTGVGVTGPEVDLDLPSVRMDGDRLEVENRSDLSFWGWGVMVGGASTVAGSELPEGGSDALALPAPQGGDFGFGFIDGLINRRELWNDPARSNSLWPLSQVLGNEVDDDGVYFVGLTDDYRPPVSVDGGARPSAGPTLVLVRAGSQGRAGMSVPAHIVDTGFVDWLDWGVQRVVSTDEMTVVFDLPDQAGPVHLEHAGRFGVVPAAYEGWSWANGAFEALDIGESLPEEMISVDGEVYVRLIGQNEFGDNPMSPTDLSLRWETS